jgi:hypothetical protein
MIRQTTTHNFLGKPSLHKLQRERQLLSLQALDAESVCGIRGIADRIPTQGGQHSDDCGQPVRGG